MPPKSKPASKARKWKFDPIPEYTDPDRAKLERKVGKKLKKAFEEKR